MRIAEILKAKGGEVVTVGVTDTVKTASQRIAEKRRGLAVVCDDNNVPVGIVSVIDINRAVARYGDRAPGMAVREVMNTDIAVCAPTDTVEQALDKMVKRAIRHLPVVADANLCGCVNMRDLLEARFDEAQMGFEEMRRYVLGVGYH